MKSAAALGLVAVIGTALIAGVHKLTAERIAAQERRLVLQRLGEILPPERYDNALHEDRFEFQNEAYFPNGQTVVAYRARREGEPVAVILEFQAVNGYNGKIGLLAGINADGTLTGVRVTSHRETPGLGDPIEAEKSDWIRQFRGKSLANPKPAGWAVRRDGGAFDQFTGATITPRAVVEAIRRALTFFEAQRDMLFNSETQPVNGATS
ncbi:MAG: electron transport complex subunit RsxG [Xanthomonadales bacterium]|nr:electron transport complex subunit RsxG [Xanthomonadales bacterium]